jgi:hypothetical protein
MSWQDDRNRGLYERYRVERLNDPHGIHIHCPYFVLDLRHDKFSVPAIEAYILACESEYPKLARDLRLMISNESHYHR